MKLMWEESKEDGVRPAAQEVQVYCFWYDWWYSYSYSYSYSTFDVTPIPTSFPTKKEAFNGQRCVQ